MIAEREQPRIDEPQAQIEAAKLNYEGGSSGSAEQAAAFESEAAEAAQVFEGRRLKEKDDQLAAGATSTRPALAESAKAAEEAAAEAARKRGRSVGQAQG